MMADLEALWAAAKTMGVIYIAFAIVKFVFGFIKDVRAAREADAVREAERKADDLRLRESIGKRPSMPPGVSRLIFKAADLRHIVDHSLAAPTQMECCIIDYRNGTPINAPPEAPGVLLIHDSGGVYLMSNGDPNYMSANLGTVAIAAGCDRDSRESRETIAALVGTEPFTECLPWAAKIKQQIDAGAQEIVIEISRTSLELLPAGQAPTKSARSILSARPTV